MGWLANASLAAALAVPIVVYAQASLDQTPTPGAVSTITFLPYDGSTFKFGTDQYYYMSMTTDGICSNHRYTGDITFEHNELFGHHVSDNFAKGETRSVPAGAGKVHIHAGTLISNSTCANGAEFSPIAGHAYKVMQQYAPGGYWHYYCSLSVTDSETQAPPPDLEIVKYCKDEIY
jgi:hypothetical protein